MTATSHKLLKRVPLTRSYAVVLRARDPVTLGLMGELVVATSRDHREAAGIRRMIDEEPNLPSPTVMVARRFLAGIYPHCLVSVETREDNLILL